MITSSTRPLRSYLRPFLACTLLCAAPTLRAVDTLLVNMTGKDLLVGARTGDAALRFRIHSDDSSGVFQDAPRRGFALADGATLQVRMADEQIPATGQVVRLDVASAAEPGKPGHLLLQMRPAAPGRRRVELTPALSGKRRVHFERDPGIAGELQEDALFYLDDLTAPPARLGAVAPAPGGERHPAVQLRETAARNAVAFQGGAGAPAPGPASESKAAPAKEAGCACAIL
jgi:hypothetical protein